MCSVVKPVRSDGTPDMQHSVFSTHQWRLSCDRHDDSNYDCSHKWCSRLSIEESTSGSIWNRAGMRFHADRPCAPQSLAQHAWPACFRNRRICSDRLRRRWRQQYNWRDYTRYLCIYRKRFVVKFRRRCDRINDRSGHRQLRLLRPYRMGPTLSLPPAGVSLSHVGLWPATSTADRVSKSKSLSTPFCSPITSLSVKAPMGSALGATPSQKVGV
jgi:hypothetical protein